MDNKNFENINNSNLDLETIKKIDYIYDHIKLQKRLSYFKFMIKLILIWAIYYFLVFYYPTINSDIKAKITDNINSTVSKKLNENIKPILSDFVIDLNDQIQQDLTIKIDNVTNWKISNEEIQNFTNDAKNQELLNEVLKLKSSIK